jgi:outer membrane murein-binding lipoprotein Lpp
MDTVICPNCKTENHGGDVFCAACGARLGTEAQPPVVPLDRAPVQAAAGNVMALEGKIHQLEGQVQQLNNQIAQLRNEVYANRGGSSALQSPNFLSRAFAVWGHYFVAQLIISLGIAIILVCLSAVLSVSIIDLFRY